MTQRTKVVFAIGAILLLAALPAAAEPRAGDSLGGLLRSLLAYFVGGELEDAEWGPHIEPGGQPAKAGPDIEPGGDAAVDGGSEWGPFIEPGG